MLTEMAETERKYEAARGAVLPELGDLPGVAAESGPDEQHLVAEYFDTPDLRLIRSGITLRRRRGGDDAGWHLKLPAGGDTRIEIRAPLGRAARRVPAELAALVRACARGEELQPVARIETARLRRRLLDESGSSLAEVVADAVAAQALGDATALSSWHEVEVELTGGDSRLLRAADQRLREAGFRPAGHQAKLERALADRLPPAGRSPALTAESPAADVVLAYVAAQLTALTTLDPMVRRGVPDSVHRMRVATRRLRSTLKSFGMVLRRDQAGQAVAELKWLGEVLGAARDAEVLAARLETAVAELPPELVIGPVQAIIRGHMAPIEAAAGTEVLAALDSGRYLELLRQLDMLLAEPPLGPQADQPGGIVLPKAVRRTRRRLHRRMRRAWAAPAGADRDIALHEARKAAKDARYAAEAASPVLARKTARRLISSARDVQSVLGDHHDAVVARGVLRDLGVQAHLAGENSFTFGILHERERVRAMALEEPAGRAWHRVGRHGG
ncbi:MAG TPA: CHAD domain containing protein [Actinobacteria bacterium]|jgi:CHAD domain-containing protein|nr:CHAD domain containing protein [Actinomycetota bacterium]